MTITAFPLDAISGSPSYTAGDVRRALSSLVGVAPSGRPLGCTSGVRPGTPTTTVTAGTGTWTVNNHSGIIDVEGATSGPYFYAVNGAVAGSMTPADTTFDRIDVIQVQISDTAVGDATGAESAQVVYTVGTPAASPVAPATAARSYVLATITVPKSGTGTPSVTWAAKAWDDSGWVSTGITPAAGVTITGQRYRKVGNRAYIYVVGTFGTTAAAAVQASASKNGDYTNTTLATLPATITPAQNWGVGSGVTGPAFVYAVIAGSGVVQITAGPPTTTAGGAALITASTTFGLSGSYLLD